MANTDNKKIQVLVNAAAKALITMRAQMVILNIIRTKFTTANPSAMGTPIEGIKAALNTELDALDTALNSANFDTVITGRSTGGAVGNALD